MLATKTFAAILNAKLNHITLGRHASSTKILRKPRSAGSVSANSPRLPLQWSQLSKSFVDQHSASI
jgi:hypothetical protein